MIKHIGKFAGSKSLDASTVRVETQHSLHELVAVLKGGPPEGGNVTVDLNH